MTLTYPSNPPQPNLPQYDVSCLYTVPVYSGADQYIKAFGAPPPPFVATRPDNSPRPVQTWQDPTWLGVAPATKVVYLTEQNGQVVVLETTAGEACTVNLLPTGEGAITDPATQAATKLPPVPPPIRPLFPNESFVAGGPSGAWQVQRSDLQNAVNVAAGQFLPADRTMMNSLATAAQVAALSAVVNQVISIVTQIQQHQN